MNKSSHILEKQQVEEFYFCSFAIRIHLRSPVDGGFWF
jgi:hypothetical protein